MTNSINDPNRVAANKQNQYASDNVSMKSITEFQDALKNTNVENIPWEGFDGAGLEKGDYKKYVTMDREEYADLNSNDVRELGIAFGMQNMLKNMMNNKVDLDD